MGLLLASGTTIAASDIALEQTVSDPTLFPGAAVDFTVTVRNLGPDATNAAHVTDRLPPGLVIPAGTTSFASQGFYDPDSGRWLVDELVAGASAALVIPALVTASSLPPCLVNEAVADRLDTDPDPDNERAFAALRRPDVDSCVDLFIDQARFLLADPVCADSTRVMMTLWVSNLGPDPARQVRVDMDVDARVIPNLVFRDDLCGTGRRETCVLDELAAGESVQLSLISDEFKNGSHREVEITAMVGTADPDLFPADNVSVHEWFLPAFSDCPPIFDAYVGAPGCFIATAAYGSAMDPHVASLRRFRDEVLLPKRSGRALVALYYRHSPPIAEFIAARPAVRLLVRGALWPLVIAVVHPVVAGLVLSLLLATGLQFLLRRRHRVAAAYGRLPASEL